ncbi:phosphotransferase [Paeniglutamicibacter psychrophenolicus]|uniref:phosphotransferase n=1 Tax=Paeniglutamicibacter psychrophenolicus TaxID=257454 RepID=UPI0027828A77|nr:phosphotransferase [Paeniglutamicibacter psychrophenolicus]MDQ0095468.1 aminoglycoside phosphotransferase (APT) family kinase protein [Paeniglutamicibacter psychrophenolicus]
MKRSPMELAAIATAAVPGLAPTGVASLPDDGNDFDSVLIVDAAKNRWRVRSPRHEEASMRLESELAALRAFSAGIRASLPFQLPSVAGTVRQGPLRTFVYNHLPGKQFSLEDLVAQGSRCARDLGTVMAAIHSMPASAIDRADLPSCTAEQVRQRRLNELDAAATTGMIPSRLLRRWEHALEDVALWRFNATVIHGDLHEDQLLVQDAKVVAVTGWTDLQVGDPADDFAWLAAVHEQSFAEAAFESYVAVRGDRADPHIMRRAALAAEFALAQWLVKAIAGGDAERIAEAKVMLEELDSDIAEYGGQPISVVEPPRAAKPEPANAPPEPVPSNERVTVTGIDSADDAKDTAEDKEPAGKPAEPETSAMRILPSPVSAAPAPPASPPIPTAAPMQPASAPVASKEPVPAPETSAATGSEVSAAEASAPGSANSDGPKAPVAADPSDNKAGGEAGNQEHPDKDTAGTNAEDAPASGGSAAAAEPETSAIPIQKLDKQ